ncbi:hypothetical protein LSTR_LSTR014640 [Laodelphax striatellus]|uniref:BZIP domain-containing protein n=1 Tax=Laodelphax striatellus TaxID=195883 RepID=A0A482WHU8_LAOST|nr:hypothetical protein LSTR_LSTR014640 [Laodelphax striatellus]
MFSTSTNAKRKQMEKISVCTTDFLTNTSGDLQVSTPNSLCLDGLNCGIPTRTTPTLTPTTLRNIEQTFIELQGGCQGLLQPGGGGVAGGDPHQAGFMPPIIQPPLSTQGSSSSIFMNLVDTKSWQGGTTVVSEAPAANTEMLRNITSSSVNTPTVSPPASSHRKNTGGRRPNRDNSISPEEEEKRKQRRERNKLAAARCRKRRLDHTNELLEETEGLESKKMSLQSEIQQLQQEKEELEYLLETHKPVCRLLNGGGGRPGSPVDVKPPLPLAVPLDKPLAMPLAEPLDAAAAATQHSMAARLEMSVARHSMNALRQEANARQRGNRTSSRAKEASVPISTPTSGVNFNFDSLMEGGTGLTPVSGPLAPSCSSQQRSHAPDLSSPVSVNTELVSL